MIHYLYRWHWRFLELLGWSPLTWMRWGKAMATTPTEAELEAASHALNDNPEEL